MPRHVARFVFGFISLLVLVASAAAPAVGNAPSNTPPPKQELFVYQVVFRDNVDRDQLASSYDALEYPTTDGTIRIIGTAETATELRASGHAVSVDAAMTEDINRPIEWNKDTFYGGYRTVSEIYTLLDQRVTQYPGLALVYDIGDSWCKQHAGGCQLSGPTLQWNGFDLKVIHISNQAIAGPKPVFWYDTGIHSREIATSELAMRYIDYLLQNYETNADVHWLVDYHDIYVMPFVNPDGHFMVEFGGNSPSTVGQRKNANYTNGCTSWNAGGTGLGTDLNRNFPFLWNCCGGSSGNACDQTYHGASAGSDPEVQQITAFIQTLIPDQRGPNNTDTAPLTTTGIIQNMHSVAELDLYPWGWTTSPSPNGPDLANIGAHMSAANANPPGNSYQSCQPPVCLYAVDGDSNDWGYGVLGVPAYTTEISDGSGGSSFYPPYANVPGIFNENRGMLLYFAKIARAPYLQTRGPDSANVVANPMTSTVGTPVQLTAAFNYAWTGNGYSQNIAAAEYYVDTPPWAGGTAIAMAPSDGNFNSPTENAMATINTTGLPLGRHIVFVRARGVNDYAGLHSWGPVSAQFFWLLGAGTPTPTAPPTATATPPVCNYDIAATTGATLTPGTASIGNACDDCVTSINLPFPVTFYNTTYTTANASSNGNLQFGSASTAFTNACLPAATLNSAIYGFWDDLRTDGAGRGVFSATLGTAPNRTFVLEWRAITFTGSNSVNFSIMMHEGNGNFEVVYASGTAPTSATLGVQFQTGATAYTQYSCNSGTLPAGSQLAYTLANCGPVATATDTATATVTGTPPSPTATSTPTSTSAVTDTPTPTATVIVTETGTPTPTPTATLTASPTISCAAGPHAPQCTVTPSETPTTTPTLTPSATVSCAAGPHAPQCGIWYVYMPYMANIGPTQ